MARWSTGTSSWVLPMRYSVWGGRRTPSRKAPKSISPVSAPRTEKTSATAGRLSCRTEKNCSQAARRPARKGRANNNGLLPAQVRKIPVVLHAPVFHQLIAGFHARQNTRVLNRLRVRLGILPGDVVSQMLRVDEVNVFGHVQRVAGTMLDGIDPGLPVEADRVDHQSVSLVPSDRV